MTLELGSSGDKEVFFTERYKVLVRSNEKIIRETAQLIPLTDRAMVHAFRYDIYRLLRSLGVGSHMQWTAAFINGVINPNQDISSLKEILIPNESVLEKMITRSNTIKK